MTIASISSSMERYKCGREAMSCSERFSLTGTTLENGPFWLDFLALQPRWRRFTRSSTNSHVLISYKHWRSSLMTTKSIASSEISSSSPKASMWSTKSVGLVMRMTTSQTTARLLTTSLLCRSWSKMIQCWTQCKAEWTLGESTEKSGTREWTRNSSLRD